MTKQSNSILMEVGTRQLQQLTTLVEETLAPDFCQAKTKSFTAADLWNIQRQAKCRETRRFLN
ncbi:MAG: hypothetical protein ABIN94_09555 [Ferruginibacter sp.]